MNHLRKIQIACGLLAAGCFAAAGLLQELRTTRSDLWEILPGRAFVVTYLWIRADDFKEQGRYYDAMQQAELICRLQRHFPGVWSFHSWNMAWNISVATHTPQERWRWVHNGLRLLRDEGIPYNPKALSLYKDLGWIFFFKIGGYLDDMHWVYKRQWATRMQDLLGAPPQGETQEVIDAFRPVAEAPLDKDLDARGREVIQARALDRLLVDPKLRVYVHELAEQGVPVGPALLDAYNRFSLDDAVSVVRLRPPDPRTDKAREISNLINSADYAAQRVKLLAFARAQILWNVYRMDPAWMLEMMKLYGPLDWRMPQPHGLYWFTYGRHVCKSLALSDVDSLNTSRNVLNCLKELTWRGRLTMIDNRPRSSTEDVMSLEPVRATSDVDLPDVRLHQLPDMRFAATTQAEYLRTIQAITRGVDRRFQRNPLRDGHINYLAAVIRMLYAGQRRKEAQGLLDWIKARYAPEGPEWKLKDAEEFVLFGLRSETEPSRDLAESLMGASLLVGLVARAREAGDLYDQSLRLARRVHEAYQKGRNERMRLAGFDTYARTAAVTLLINPRAAGYNLTLADRSQIYKSLDAETQEAIHKRLIQPLKHQCEQEKVDFDKAFPAPASAPAAAP